MPYKAETAGQLIGLKNHWKALSEKEKKFPKPEDLGTQHLFFSNLFWLRRGGHSEQRRTGDTSLEPDKQQDQ